MQRSYPRMLILATIFLRKYPGGKHLMNIRPLCLLFLFILFIITTNLSSHVTARKVTPLVDGVCRKTSSYSFCVESLYSDPHTPDADSFFLADISFRLAYVNTTSSLNHIAKLLKHSSPNHGGYKLLQRCALDYKRAISKFGAALNDLNSETYEGLIDYTGVAAQAANDCQEAMRGTQFHTIPPLNKVLKSLCEICLAVSKLFVTA